MRNALIDLDRICIGKDNSNVVIDPTKSSYGNLPSRFRVGNGVYEPYDLDYMKLKYLDSRVSFINPGKNDICNFSNFKNYVYSHKVHSDAYKLWMPTDFNDKLVKCGPNLSDRSYRNYDISIMGILALLTRWHYNDPVFKDFIENRYLKLNYEYSDTYGLWILDDKHRSELSVTKDFIIHLIDLNYNLGIKYMNDRIPYTFMWRDVNEL